MFFIPKDLKIYLAVGFTDMRKGINGLSLSAQALISKDTFANSIFIFRGSQAKKVKLLWWDGQGFCLFYKRFDSGKVFWSDSDGDILNISQVQLKMLLEGIDWRPASKLPPPKYGG